MPASAAVSRGPPRWLVRALAILALTAGFSETAFAQFTITLQPNTLPPATLGTAYSQVVTAVGGNAPYTFSVSSGSLPAGLSLDPDGTISGTPTASGSPTFQIQATDVRRQWRLPHLYAQRWHRRRHVGQPIVAAERFSGHRL